MKEREDHAWEHCNHVLASSEWVTCVIAPMITTINACVCGVQDVDDLKQCLQQEIKARVVLENRFQDLLDKLDVNPADQNTS